nr:tautomerase family protein [Prevotella sp.]
MESGILTQEQKEELIEKLTSVSSEITGIPQQFFMVSIKELSDDNIGIGGKTIGQTKKEYFNNIKK